MIKWARRCAAAVREVRQYPPVCERIVDHYRIAATVTVAKGACPCKYRVLWEGLQPCFVFAVDSVCGVSRLNVMVRTDRSIGVGRRVRTPLAAVADIRPSDSRKVLSGSRHGQIGRAH